ncbi:16044_t:CDS:1, partial [Acaulospora colombiana]
YIEPGVLEIKHYGKQAFEATSLAYENYAKPYVDPSLELLQPHLQVAMESSISYVNTAQEMYDQHAKEHVDTYYNQAKEAATPYVLKLQEYTIIAYNKASEFNEKKAKPFYHEEVIPRVIKAKDYYHTKVVPYAKSVTVYITEKYHEHVVPAYQVHIEPHALKLW